VFAYYSHFVNLQTVVKHGIKLDYTQAQENSGILHYNALTSYYLLSSFSMNESSKPLKYTTFSAMIHYS